MCVYCVYTTSQKFLDSNIFKELSSAHQLSLHLFDPKYSKSSNFEIYLYYNVKKNYVIYSCDFKAEF